MKSKITKIQILKNGVVIMLSMMFLLTPIVYAATSLDDDSTPNDGNNATNNVVNIIENNTTEGNTDIGNNTTVPDDSSSESGSSSGGLNWKEIFYGKVGAAADEIKKKIAKDENGANKPGIIEIEDEIQLRAIAELVNNGENNFKNITIILTKDIVINSDVEWVPIGIDNSGDANEEDYVDKTFRGNFIGCELDEQGKVKDTTVAKRISNLEYLKEGKTYKELTNIGLFGVIGENATIQNIIIDNFNINVLYDNSDILANDTNNNSTAGKRNTYYYNAGNIAGINKGTIINCTNLSDIKGGSCVGSIVGTNIGTVENCTNTGVVIGYDIVGGIAGSNEGTIKECKNIGDVKGAEQDIGGIVGLLNGGTVILSHNTGNVQGNIQTGKAYVGGIVGGNYNNGSIKYCMHEGKTIYQGDTKKIYGILGNMDESDDEMEKTVIGCITKAVVSESGDLNQVAYLCDIGVVDWSLLDEDEKNWGFVIEDPLPYENYDSGYGIFEIGQSGKIQNIKYNVDGNEYSVFIVGGNRQEQSAGNVIYNPLIKGNNTFDEEGGFDVGSGLDVDIENKDDEEPVVPQEPTEPEEAPLQEGEVRQDITGFFPKTEEDKEDGSGKGDASKTTVSYIVKKGDKVITDKAYYRFIKEENEGKGAGEVITVVATFNKYLEAANGDVISQATAPILKIGNDTDGYKEMTPKAEGIIINPTNATSTIVYEYEVQAGDNFEAENIKISGCKDIKATGKDGKTAVGIDGEVITKAPVSIIVDTIAPTLKTKVYVENNLETRRYKAGKVILFEVTVSEAVNELYTVKPLIQVNFSESGKGLYNYYIENGIERVGIAKFRSDLTPTEPNEDGTVTWIYSYQIQEGDEGELEPEYLEYQIVDFAGNKASSESGEISEDVTGNDWGAEDLNISIEKLYTEDGKEITEDTVLTNEDTLFIDVKFDKVLYAVVGILNGEEFVNTRLNDVIKGYAPSLYLNGNKILKQTSIEKIDITDYAESTDTETSKSGTTTITYKYNLGDIISAYDLDRTIRIRKLVLKNDNNEIVATQIGVGGELAYAEKWIEKYNQTEKELYGIVEKNAKKEFEMEYRVNVNPNENVFEIVYDYIYADTTLPTVQITTNTTDPTKAEEIIYTFKFSEYVKGFEEDDITVNGGYKATRINDKGNEEVDFTVVKDGYEYTLKVIPTIPVEKEGTLQVIVEKGACLDLVAKELVRQEKNITIDRVKPTFIDYSVEQKVNEETGRIETITVTTVFSEELLKTSSTSLIPTLTIDGNEYKGTLDANVEGNKIIYVYNTNASEGGKVELSLNGTVKDKAGNSSEEMIIEVENNITLEKEIIKDVNDANVYYTFNDKNGNAISDYTKPTYFGKGDKITVTKYEDIEVDGKIEQEITVYEYYITEGIAEIFQKFNSGKPAKMPLMLLIDSQIKDTPGKIEFALEGSNYINISEANIYFDVVAPSVTLSVEVEEANGDNIYKEGKELIITATTSEAIQNADSVPEIKVGFTNSGSGKYNNGIAKYEETITNADGSTTWKYKYIAQDGDDGKVVVEYAQVGTVTDLAGNKTTLKVFPPVEAETPELTDNEISEKEGGATKVSYEFYKKAEKENEYKEITGFAQNTYFAAGDTIKVVAKFDKLLYSIYTDKNRVQLNENDLSKDLIDGLEGEISVSHNDEEETTTITYIYEVKDTDKEELLNNINLKADKDIYSIYTEENEITDEEGNTTIESKIVKGTISATIANKNIESCNLWIYNSTTVVSSGNINIDTVRPRVSIKPDVGNITNSDKIIYTFEFTEEVVDFTEDDITVSGGTKDTLVKIEDKNVDNVYQLEVVPDVAEGNVGNVQVIVEKDTCTDKVGLGNVRAENIVKVDRELPDFIKFVAYAPTESNIKLSEEVNAIKEYYTVGDTLKIVASFSESITTEAKPVLLFGGKNAKGELTQEKTTGNNITYTYTIVDGDEGILTIGGFVGNAVDAARNGITLSNRPLVGDTIIADTTAPTLNEIKVTSPKSGVYKAGNTITIEAIYDEEIYVLENNEVKLIKKDINNAPALMISFGNGENKEATVSGYGTKDDGSEDRTKLIYTYTIVDGDNGDLEVDLYANRVNENNITLEVCDIAGNVAKLNKNLKGNQITADTTRPTVDNITAEVVVNESTISNTGIYNKAGNEVKVTVKFNEPVYSAVEKPVINIGFSESEGVEPEYNRTAEYSSVLTESTDTIEFVYTIQEDDNGYLWIKVPENQFKDVALLDGNLNATMETGKEITDIYADTAAPKLTSNGGTDTSFYVYTREDDNGVVTAIKAEAIFSEEIFSMKNDKELDNTLNTSDIPKVGLFINGIQEGEFIDPSTIKKSVNENGQTVLESIIDASNIDTKGNISVNFTEGTVYDRAGNKWTIDIPKGKDTALPIFKDIKVVTQTGFYKAGETIEIVARFDEQSVLLTVPALKIRIGSGEVVPLTGSYNPEDDENTDTIKVARYSYKIVDGDNGALNIISLEGNVTDRENTSKEISKIYIDLTNNMINDVNAQKEELLNSEEQQYANNQEEYVNVIADTKAPYVSKVEAKVDGKVISSYTKEEGKDAVRVENKINKFELEYVVTFSELIKVIDDSRITINFGEIAEITNNDSDKDGYYNQVTIKVKNINQLNGQVHLLSILDNLLEDRAGNKNATEYFDTVTIDVVEPEIIFTNNDGIEIFVIPTSNSLTIVQGVEITEDISKLEYKWDNGEYVNITETYLRDEKIPAHSRIVIPEKEFTSEGTHKLYVKATDIAGNTKEAWKEYSIKESYIQTTLSTSELINQDIYVTVNFGEGLTENRIVTFKAEGSDDYVEKTPNADGTYTITENGIVHVKASDKAGHEVFTERTIANVDKEAPVVEIALDRADLVIGTKKDKATIKTAVEVSDNRILEYAKYAFIQEDIDIDNMNALEKAKIDNNLNGEAKKEDAESTKGKTPYYLYVIAKDKAGTETIEKAGPFTVLDTNERTILETVTPDILDDLLNPGDENNEPETVKKTVPPEVEKDKLISFNQEGKYISISYNNFGEGEEYLDIIKEKDITLTDDEDGIYYEEESYVYVNKPTTITVVGKDACGNEVINTKEITRDSIEGPEFEVYGNPEYWTNQNVILEVYASEELSALTVNGQNILSEDKFGGSVVITENGEYKFVATDMYGLTSEKVIKVTKIDKVKSVISKVETSGKDITITATDVVNEIEGSGVAEYAITDTTELPVEWSESNVIKVTHDGAFFVWVKDIAGNVTRTEEATIVDTTAPTIRFEYTLLSVVAGMPIEANIITDEEAIISYSWDEETWVDSEEFITNVRVAKKYDMTGKYTLYAKANDKYGNESKSQIEFTVTKPEEVLDPQVVFEGLYTTQIDGVHYVKVAANMTTEDVTNKMKKDALCGVTPEYTKLAEGNELKTGSEITLNGDTKYIVVVNGDVNCDGKIDFLGDIISANNYRIGVSTLNTIQKLAADIDNDGKVEFISDILAMNNYRIGITSSL